MGSSSFMGGRAAIILAVTGAVLALTAITAGAVKPIDPIGKSPRGKLVLAFSPKKLPKTKQVPVAARAVARFWAEDGAQVPALEELRLRLDRHLHLDLDEVPPCRGGYFDVRGNGPDKSCPDSIVGRGELTVEVRFPDQPPAEVSDKLTIFKGPWRGGPAGLYLYAELEAPVASVIVVPMETKADAGNAPYLEASAEFPDIASGAGSITRLELRFRKGVFTARCPRTGALRAAFSARFSEGHLRGEAESRPCG